MLWRDNTKSDCNTVGQHNRLIIYSQTTMTTAVPSQRRYLNISYGRLWRDKTKAAEAGNCHLVLIAGWTGSSVYRCRRPVAFELIFPLADPAVGAPPWPQITIVPREKTIILAPLAGDGIEELS